MQSLSAYKKGLILFALILAVILLVKNFLGKNQWQESPISHDDSLISYPDKLPLPAEPVLAPYIDSTHADSDGAPLLWVNTNTKMPVTLPESVTEKAVVVLDKALLMSLTTGDEVQLLLPDGRQIMAIVDQVLLNPNADRTLRAQVKTEFGDYPFVYTMGINSGFGFVGLPEGRFVIETYGQEGVIYKTPEQPRSSDPNKKDYVIPAQ
jgi:hypothetical protein